MLVKQGDGADFCEGFKAVLGNEFDQKSLRQYAEKMEQEIRKMTKLRLKLWRVENAVLMSVLEQDDDTRGEGALFESNDISIKSEANPDLVGNSIYIRGRLEDRDHLVGSKGFPTEASALEFIVKVQAVIRAYNQSLTEPNTDKSDDIESFIAE